jgi:hypothetical protein
MDFHPILPTCFKSACPAMPTTSVPNNNGAMIVLIRRMKILLTIFKCTAIKGMSCPNSAPASMLKRIHVVRDFFFREKTNNSRMNTNREPSRTAYGIFAIFSQSVRFRERTIKSVPKNTRKNFREDFFIQCVNQPAKIRENIVTALGIQVLCFTNGSGTCTPKTPVNIFQNHRTYRRCRECALQDSTAAFPIFENTSRKAITGQPAGELIKFRINLP